MYDFLKGQDFFGKPVMLSLRKEGDTVNTLQGGLISFAIKCFMLWYTIVQGIKLAFKQNNSYGFLKVETDFNDLGEVSMGDSGLLFII